MQFENIGHQLAMLIENSIDGEIRNWLNEKIKKITLDKSVKDLYLTYSLIASKIQVDAPFSLATIDSELKNYIELQNGNIQQIARIYVLITVLNSDNEFFTPKVGNIIQVADTGELETFLKFLILLPKPEAYKHAAVDALRTNISTVFNAIAFNNPYPGLFFDEQQWNQMYLKTAFMQGDLSQIADVDKRANKELARIISDYAHERWAASREIDPYFWRPVPKYLDALLLEDMKRLFESKNILENRAAALCCYTSDKPEAKQLLGAYPIMQSQVENKEISWENLKN